MTTASSAAVADHQTVPDQSLEKAQDSGLAALVAIAAHYRIDAAVHTLQRDLALQKKAMPLDLVRAAGRIGLKARKVDVGTIDRLRTLPTPAIFCALNGSFTIFAGVEADHDFRLIEPIGFGHRTASPEELLKAGGGSFILLQRKLTGPGIAPSSFGFRWFLPSLWRYRSALSHVLLASLFIQLFALVTPLFFQIVIDKVLANRSYSTLLVVVVGLAVIGLFDVVLQYLRTYALSHTTNRIDVDLGRRLFRHMMRLPMTYFETRAAGQTVARVRELETIRDFLTGQGLFCALDLAFTFVFIAVLFSYSAILASIVVASLPVYFAIGAMIRPFLKHRIDEKFDRGAFSQQLLVETVVGIQTLKASAVEPAIASQWEERLAGYVKASFAATLLAAKGQNAIQYVSKLTNTALLLFGAQEVIEGHMTVGALIAFNMIAAQVAQPVLRLSQLWQDIQQVQVSIQRLADILNAGPEPRPSQAVSLPAPTGAVRFKDVSFRYSGSGQDVLKDISLSIDAGEVVGIVGPSGSGKSTLTKLVQRFYTPDTGQVFMDGLDLAQVDPAWLRSNIGVVLQENMLFNRTIHENIVLANPALDRQAAMRLARLSGADEFIAKLPRGYDTLIEERGANLSGGQRQRLAIARALATDPPVLILDEATSALDFESERIILANMRDIVRGRTVIIIAHRLATVRYCNRIVGLKDGRIVEQGSHDELLTKDGGLYAHLWKLQNGVHAP